MSIKGEESRMLVTWSWGRKEEASANMHKKYLGVHRNVHVDEVMTTQLSKYHCLSVLAWVNFMRYKEGQKRLLADS